MEDVIQDVDEPAAQVKHLDLGEVELSGWWRRAGAFIFDNILIAFASMIATLPFALLIFNNIDLNTEDVADPFELIISIFFLFFIWSVIYFLISGLYWGLLMKRSGDKNGQSLGQELFSIKVARLNGQEIGFWWAFLRQVVVIGILLTVVASVFSFVASIPLLGIFPDSDVAGALAYLSYYVPYLANFLWPLWDSRNQALHDKVVSSVVIKA